MAGYAEMTLLIMSGIIWAIGIMGIIINRENLIGIVISMEIMILGGLWAQGEGTIIIGNIIGEL